MHPFKCTLFAHCWADTDDMHGVSDMSVSSQRCLDFLCCTFPKGCTHSDGDCIIRVLGEYRQGAAAAAAYVK